MSKAKGQNYMHGAAILTVGVIVMKVLGLIYKVPIQNIIKDDGYSMFLATYNVYNVFLTLATAGLPIALSRMVSEANAQNRPMQIRRIFSVAWWTFFAIGLLFSSVMYLFPDFLAGQVLHNPEASLSIRVMSPAVLMVCVVSAYRGYCQGLGNMIPTTVGQVLEVLVKVLVGLTLAYLMTRNHLPKPVASAGAIAGVAAGALAALVYMAIYKARRYKDEETSLTDTPDSSRDIFLRLLRIGIPIALGSSILSILNLIDSGLCMGRLQSAARFSLNEAQTLYGAYGSAQTLFNLPAAFITPLTISVVPAISAAYVRRQSAAALKISEDSMRIATVISLPMGVGISVLSFPLMRLFYRDGHPCGPTLLAIMGAASFFVCLALMENAILQASGKEKYPMYSMLIGGVVKIVINWFLVADRNINIYGAPIGTLASYMVMCVMNYIFMCSNLEKAPNLGRIFLRPMACSALMGVTAWAVYGFMRGLVGANSWSHMALCAFAAIAAAVIVYAASTIALRSITQEDMSLIPGGDKLAKLLHLR